ncbi:uncharacterized protein K460DRAFT_92714 [Cucurbitaria berberidis CBS 394.84]|uniref:Uncharacterized protein n=1 Tax=Cucurbitaria berberidis CBS 394.84 TaxID=1168544 RepID=A0A9P4L7T8_9PLEO|nr:uncharacterized protein K460DRAFT_92714 [Cucurbitaria berberidis CBS 394.84]KAF1844478.1 hypothetical protein K460DRAFT_92714 [Cucurbitaria berberidis CBS 394.84]
MFCVLSKIATRVATRVATFPFGLSGAVTAKRISAPQAAQSGPRHSAVITAMFVLMAIWTSALLATTKENVATMQLIRYKS